MLDESIRAQIRIEDLPSSDVRRIAEACGLDVALALVENYSGIGIYVPKDALYGFFKRHIRDNHNRLAPKELAVKLGVTERFVYNVLKELNGGPLPQPGLFDNDLPSDPAIT